MTEKLSVEAIDDVERASEQRFMALRRAIADGKIERITGPVPGPGRRLVLKTESV